MYRELKLTKRVLYNKAKPFTFENPGYIKRVAKDLENILKSYNAVGVAAPQCGLSKRLFLVQTTDSIISFFNPEIIESSDKKIEMEEGCLSFPNQFIKISRPESVFVKYQNIEGEVFEKEFFGLDARCFQHELDHLDGITFFERYNNV